MDGPAHKTCWTDMDEALSRHLGVDAPRGSTHMYVQSQQSRTAAITSLERDSQVIGGRVKNPLVRDVR